MRTAYARGNPVFVLPTPGRWDDERPMDAWLAAHAAIAPRAGFDQPKTIAARRLRGGCRDLGVCDEGRDQGRRARLVGGRDHDGHPSAAVGKLPARDAARAGLDRRLRRVALDDPTEYFKGTVPTTFCPLHQSPSFMDRLAGAFGIERGLPVSAEATGLPAPPPARTSGSVPAPSAVSSGDPAEPKVDEPKKKRGFWSRVFGKGKDDKDKKDKQQDPRKQDPVKPDPKKPPSRPPGL